MRLGYLSRCHATKGLLAVVDGDTAGWSLIHLGVEYLFAELRTSTVAALQGPADLNQSAILTLSLPRCACLASYGRLAGFGEMEKFCLELLRRHEANPEQLDVEWSDRPFERFVLRVLDPQHRIEVGRYEEVLSGSPDAINDACDFHLDNMKKVGNRMPEFEQPPFDLIPIEMFLIEREVGLTLPEHPLLDIGFVPPPEPSANPLLLAANQAHESAFS